MRKTAVFALRCVASEKVGLGHAIRLLSLARYLPNTCLVVSPETAINLRSLPIDLPPVRFVDPSRPVGEWCADMADITHVVLDTCFSGNADTTAREVAALKTQGRRIAVIDSMPPDHFLPLRGGLPDLLVTPYVGAGHLRPPVEQLNWVYGPRYAILPREFIEARVRQKDEVHLPKRILVTCGGSDPTGLSARVLSELSGLPIGIDVVVGPLFSEALKAQLNDNARRNLGITLHNASSGLVRLIEGTGLVIGRPGLTRYEVACLGRQAVYLVEGHSYLDYFRAFAAAGLADLFIAEEAGGAEAFVQKLRTIRSDTQLELGWKKNQIAWKSVDAQGAARVARAIRHITSLEQE